MATAAVAAQAPAPTVQAPAAAIAAAPAMDFIRLNSDKDKNYLVETQGAEWVGTSQAGGVYRRMCQRLGGEVARATTVVRFDPNQSFPPHTHAGGEEFFVLDGHWRDEYGVFPKYTYVRNYIGSKHQPFVGDDGVRILVRLRQMAHEHKEPEHRNWDGSPGSGGWVAVDAGGAFAPAAAEPEEVAGIAGPGAEGGGDGKSKRRRCSDGFTTSAARHRILRKDLYRSPFEEVFALQLLRDGDTAGGSQPSVLECFAPPKGLDLFVVDGSMASTLGTHSAESWAQFVGGERLRFEVQEDVYVLVKQGHLESPEVGV
eukprot:CAMPEP_0170231744 /NCGR_PEP_ID=MMETSP0116_2-20130129/15608_1 /TAXON_ID=400756 /ORGANISM="Durinskia baltica, Strain CSIRO CS-38" /LENGTH=313 /DNA_ID=CAMNT_0010482519 /DNA_START=112 /DNA_END=1053 /DNA_ORIENTATION=+